MHELLIIEDESDIREILTFNLENVGYHVLTAASAEQGLEMLSPNTSLILLDVMLPGMSGFQLAYHLRKELNNHVPIIFLTARTEENDILTGFSAGGDDYIHKPFSINEVAARVKAVLKRSEANSAATSAAAESDSSLPDGQNVPGVKFIYGELEIDPMCQTVRLSGNDIGLSRKEFDLLAMLAAHPDTYYSRSMLIASLWTDSPYVLDRTVDVHIARIRSKLGTYHDIIRNKTGFGYYLDSSYVG